MARPSESKGPSERPRATSASKEPKKKMLSVKQVRGWAGCPRSQLRTLWGLGLGKTGRTVLREDTPDIRGMLLKVRHMVEVTESEER